VNCSHRHGVKDRIYPAVSPTKGDKVYGKVGVFLNPGPAVVTLTTWKMNSSFSLFHFSIMQSPNCSKS
jgi:hypothetical protein